MKPTDLRAAIVELAMCLRQEAESYEQMSVVEQHKAAQQHNISAQFEQQHNWVAAVWHGQSRLATSSAERLEALLATYTTPYEKEASNGSA